MDSIGIDWDRDGSYTDETARVLSAKWMLGFQQAYMDVGNDAQLRLLMRNDDKRFTPENSAGSLYGKLAPLRPVKIESHDGTTTRRHFSGWVQSIHPAANRNGERTAAIQVAGAMQFLKATETKIELQENQRSDQIIDALIQEVIFPPALSDSWVLGDPGPQQGRRIDQAGQSGSLPRLRRGRADAEPGGGQLGAPGRVFGSGERHLRCLPRHPRHHRLRLELRRTIASLELNFPRRLNLGRLSYLSAQLLVFHWGNFDPPQTAPRFSGLP